LAIIEVGYKDLLKDWNPTKLDPAALEKRIKMPALGFCSSKVFT